MLTHRIAFQNCILLVSELWPLKVTKVKFNSVRFINSTFCLVCMWFLYGRFISVVCSSLYRIVHFSCSVGSDSLWPPWMATHQASLSITNSQSLLNSCPLSQWCHPNISSSVIPFSSHLQSFPASGPFQTSQFFTSGSQSIGVSASASVLPKNTQDCFPLGWTDWISLQSKGLSRVFSKSRVRYKE